MICESSQISLMIYNKAACCKPGDVNRTRPNGIFQSRDQNQSNQIERLMFDCQTKSNINRNLPENFDWFRLNYVFDWFRLNYVFDWFRWLPSINVKTERSVQRWMNVNKPFSGHCFLVSSITLSTWLFSVRGEDAIISLLPDHISNVS